MRRPPAPIVPLAVLACAALGLAACGLPHSRSLEDASARSALSSQMVATLERQRHYFHDPVRRASFERAMREVAGEARDAKSFYLGASVALATLDEGHTALVGSAEVPFTATIPPVALMEVEGSLFVAGVAPGVEGGGLREGDAILEVDGEAVEAVLALRLRETPGSTEHGRRSRAVANLLAGPTRVPAAVRVRGIDGRERNCYPLRFLLDDEGEDRFRFGFLPLGLSAQRVSASEGYLRLPDFHPERIPEMERALEVLGPMPHLILDLRGNPGGRIQTLQRVAGFFLGAPTDIAVLAQERWSEPLRSAYSPLVYRGTLRVLIDERTGSASEILAAALQDLGRAVLIGRTTAGSTRSRLSTVLPGGITFHYAGSAEFRRRDGRPIEGIGVEPDTRVLPTREDLARGAYGDPLLDPVARAGAGGRSPPEMTAGAD